MKSVTAETEKQRWEREVLEPALEKSPERNVPVHDDLRPADRQALHPRRPDRIWTTRAT